MKHKLSIMFFALAAILAAQNTVTVRIGTKTWSFTLPVSITSLSCDQTTLIAGQSSICTLTLDSPAPAGGFSVTPYTADSPLVLNPATLVVPANAVSIQFTVTRPIPAAPPIAGN